jgi:Zn-dependent protease with chaperone function
MSSNFFSQQDLARRNTRLLVLLFSLAVLLLLLLTNALTLVSLGFIAPATLTDIKSWSTLPWDLLLGVSLCVLVAVSLAVLFKWLQLQGGGKVVAESLGGQRLSPDSQEPLQRRLLNVVEEMALAAGTPVPPVYLLPESGINAFAAGYSPADAVIGVTQGCLEQLNRDELQGVIAHEFSHILNGDMRMNIRLIAILNGILFLGHIGYYMLRGSRGSSIRVGSRSGRNKNSAGGILVLALGLIVIGYLGAFFGNLIKAAVSRQREFLADASAVQFTRNNRGIAGALKVIGSHSNHSKIRNPNADENSHLFFGEAISRWASVFATHPPLATRIKRLEPGWNGKFPSPRTKQHIDSASTAASAELSDTAPASQRNTERLQHALPLLLLHSSRQSEPAMALVCCMLLRQDDHWRTKQLQLIKNQGSAVLLQQVDQLCDAVDALDALQQVQLLQTLIPALKTLTLAQFRAFEQLLNALLPENAEPPPTAWLASQFVRHTVAAHFDKQQIVRSYSDKSLVQHSDAVLPLLALVSRAAGDRTQQLQAWQAALATLPFNTEAAPPELTLAHLNQAFSVLLTLAPQTKQQLWQAIVAAIKADQLLQTEEKALLSALALLLEVPYQAQTH